MKTCFKCGDYKSLDDFYKHKEMKDGHLGKCKECCKQDARERERLHGKEIYLREKQTETPEQRKRRQDKQKIYRVKHPEKYKARTAVNNALRRGAIVREPCESCGNPKVQAHHEDYSKKLEINWLCRKCHLATHDKEAYEL